MNRVMIVGRLTRDPELRYIPNGTPVVNFCVADGGREWTSKDGEKKKSPVVYLDCSMFGVRAEVVAKHFSKGDPIIVSGSLKTESWEDKNGGGKRYKTSLRVDEFEFVPRPKSRDSDSNPPPPASSSAETYDIPYMGDSSDDTPSPPSFPSTPAYGGLGGSEEGTALIQTPPVPASVPMAPPSPGSSNDWGGGLEIPW